MTDIATFARPSDTTIPGETRRRIWAMPEVRSHSMLLLTATGLHLAPSMGVPREETVTALQNGGDPETLIGPLGTTVPYALVRSVTLHLSENRIRVKYQSARHHSATVTIEMENAELADALFSKLWRRLGSAFLLAPFRKDMVTLAGTPATMLGGVLIGTILIALWLNSRQDGATPTGLDWRLVCGIGGVTMAMIQVWLYRRVTQPPTRLSIDRTAPSS